MFVGFRGADGQTVGAVAAVTPWRSSFVKIGAEATPRSRDGAARFLWGLGFESARDNTLFAHLHDWGPVRPGEAFTLRHSELEAGYKLPRVCGGPLCLATSVFATLPLSGVPYGGPRVTLTAARRWYATVGLGRTIPGVREERGPAGWRLEYGFGRWDWRPGTLFVAYREALSLARLSDVEATYRQGNGVLTAGITWAH
jgi:hypothetical protein